MMATKTLREPLYGPADLARRLGVSRSTIYRLRDQGALPAPLVIGGTLRWDPRIIEEWIRQGAPAPEGGRRAAQ